MLLSVKLICRTKRVHEDGTCTLFVQYCHGEKKVLLHTGIKIPSRYWSKIQECVSDNLPLEYGVAADLNKELLRIRSVVNALALKAKALKTEERGKFIKASFSRDLVPDNVDKKIVENEKKEKELQKASLDVYFQFDEYIKSKQRKVGRATLTVYGNVKSHLLAFETYRQEKITFDSFDFAFYENFVDYLTFEHIHLRRQTVLTGLRLNTIGKTIKHLRGFIKDRVKRKIIPPIDLTDFKIPEEESDAIYLSHDEIGKIYQTDLTDYPQLLEYRDLFVLACLTGLRFSDFSNLKPEDLQKDMLYKKQEKSDHWVVIPLREEAKLIFTRQFKEKIPALTNPEFNRHIKTIGKLAGITKLVKFSYKKGNKSITITKPKFDWITSHTARRSFCTNEFLAGTPVELIMKISGHKRTKDFYKYIRITPEEAAIKIKELWLARNDMKLIRDATEQLSIAM